jgi:hypothetical protein
VEGGWRVHDDHGHNNEDLDRLERRSKRRGRL